MYGTTKVLPVILVFFPSLFSLLLVRALLACFSVQLHYFMLS